MPTILHITDLHLVAEADSEPLESHRVSLVPSADRSTRQRLLRYTLQALSERLQGEGRVLDAVIVTGDVAEKNNPEGYTAFLDLIEALGTAKPSPDHIVVVPGNHDVKAGLMPGDSDRYEEFVRHIRSAGFITPWLYGVDGPIATPEAARRHVIVLQDVQVVPIDSAAFSQVKLDIGISDRSWQNLEAVLRGQPGELDALRRLRIVDAARVSNDHLEALRRVLLYTTSQEGARPLRIAALHHHLLPVSVAEEVKPFESLTNLGRVRQFLRDEGFAIVLHGHKHTPFSYVDYVSSYNLDSDAPVPIRVLSGAAASGVDLDRADVFRLLDVDSEGGVMRVRRVGLVALASPLRIKEQETLTFSHPGAAQVLSTTGCTVIDGDTVEVVYPQLVTRVSEEPGELGHVICSVKRSPRIAEIALIYPKLPTWDEANRLKEFHDLVKWWQLPSVPLTPMDQPGFTHGSRIRAYNGHLDQVREVIESLRTDSATSRSMIVLLNPPADQIAKHEVPFPSFCIVQFGVQEVGDTSSPTLACTAYFRKQEVRYWWLVNLAELADLQRQICDALNQDTRSELRNIQPGPITTVAARAHAGDSPPKVQVPLVDRFYGLSRERLYAMVHALIWDAMPDRAAYAAEWRGIFSELVPPETRDPDGLAIAQQGLKYLLEEISHHLEASGSRGELLRSLHRKLEKLLAANQEFALNQQKNAATSDKYQEWRNGVTPLIDSVIELSSRLIASISESTESH